MTTAQWGDGEAKVWKISYWHGTTALSGGQLYKALGGLYISMWWAALDNGKEHWAWGIGQTLQKLNPPKICDIFLAKRGSMIRRDIGSHFD